MSQTLTGTVQGNTIVLDAPPSFADGQSVEVVIRSNTPSTAIAAKGVAEDNPPDWWSPEDDRILEEIYRARKQERRPQY